MDSIQPYKTFKKTSSLSRLGQHAQYRDFASQSSPGDLSVTCGLFFVYRKVLIPLLHAFGLCGCRFVPSCSHYAEYLLKQKWSLRNFSMVAGRLLRCNAWITPVLTFDPPAPDYLLKNI